MGFQSQSVPDSQARGRNGSTLRGSFAGGAAPKIGSIPNSYILRVGYEAKRKVPGSTDHPCYLLDIAVESVNIQRLERVEHPVRSRKSLSRHGFSPFSFNSRHQSFRACRYFGNLSTHKKGDNDGGWHTPTVKHGRGEADAAGSLSPRRRRSPSSANRSNPRTSRR